MARYALYALISAVVILADQLTKGLVEQTMSLHQSIEVIPSFFHLTYIRNPGAAFGLFVGMSPEFRVIFFRLITVAAIAFILFYFVRAVQDERHRVADGLAPDPVHRWLCLGLALVLGGAIGNFIDRLRYREVIDFLDFFIQGYHWPAFNVADSSITVGISILVVVHFWPFGARPAARHDG